MCKLPLFPRFLRAKYNNKKFFIFFLHIKKYVVFLCCENDIKMIL